jgi:predicted nucleotidyltransferase
MSDTLINITGKLDQPTIELFIAVNEVMVNADAGYLVVGASARDLVLHFGYGTRIDRATSDIDFGINSKVGSSLNMFVRS